MSVIHQKIETLFQNQQWEYVQTQTGYKVEIQLSGRSQVVELNGFNDPDGQPMIEFVSNICETAYVNDLVYLLRLNLTLPYGAIALKNEYFVMRATQLVNTADHEELKRLTYYIASQADRLESQAKNGADQF
jgi:hypothetical protein